MTLHYLSGRTPTAPSPWHGSRPASRGAAARLGFHTVYPENHGRGLLREAAGPGALRRGGALGYSRDLCGYARADLGCAIAGTTPVAGCRNRTFCAAARTSAKPFYNWFRALADRFRVPLVVIDAPFVYGEAKAGHLEYFDGQLRISWKPRGASPYAPRPRRARRNCPALPAKASLLWRLPCGRAGQAVPVTGFDAFFHMAPIVALRGTKECNGYYRMLRDELNLQGLPRRGRDPARAGPPALGQPSGVAPAAPPLRPARGERVQYRVLHVRRRVGGGRRHDRPGRPGRLPRAPWRGPTFNVLLNRDLPYRLSC
jgi:hypothetical protein